MSFSCMTGVVPKDELDAKIDALVASPPITTDHGKAMFEAVQTAAKALAEQMTGTIVTACASVSGHDGSEDGSPNSVTVNVYEYALAPAPTPPAPTA